MQKRDMEIEEIYQGDGNCYRFLSELFASSGQEVTIGTFSLMEQFVFISLINYQYRKIAYQYRKFNVVDKVGYNLFLNKQITQNFMK